MWVFLGLLSLFFAVFSSNCSTMAANIFFVRVTRAVLADEVVGVLGPVQTRCPCQGSDPGHWNGHCSDSLVPKEQSYSRSFIYCPPFCLTYHREAWGKGMRTDKIPFTPVPRNDARVLPLEVVPRFLLEHPQYTMFRLGAVPENRARAPSLNRALDRMATSALLPNVV